MKPAKTLLVAAVVGLALAALSAPASAHGYYRGGYYGGPRVHFSLGYWGVPGYWGPGYWGSGYWGPGYGYWGYPPATVVVPAEPRVYVERDEAPAAAPSTQQWWYWCASAKGYYPYVSTCSEGWQRVPPQPPQVPR